MDMVERKQVFFDGAANATNVEDRDRFNDLQYEVGEQMEKVRSEIIENNNRLK